jgi:hypothetical protein
MNRARNFFEVRRMVRAFFLFSARERSVFFVVLASPVTTDLSIAETPIVASTSIIRADRERPMLVAAHHSNTSKERDYGGF